MSSIIIYLSIPIIGMLVGNVGFQIIDSKLRRILEKQGKNPNPKELEKFNCRFVHIGNAKRVIKEVIEYRRSIDQKLGDLYFGIHVFQLVLFIGFLALIIGIK